jgi:hypothetical protein
MYHRKRSQLQHKVELPIQLKIVMAKKRTKQAVQPQNNEVVLANQLIAEAIELINKHEATETANKKSKRTFVGHSKAIF